MTRRRRHNPSCARSATDKDDRACYLQSIGTRGWENVLSGNDKLQGDHGRDRIYGGAGNDTFFTWDGFADVLDGGLGTDRAFKDKPDRVYSVERSG